MKENTSKYQTANYDLVMHYYVGNEPVGKKNGLCARKGCVNYADCPWSYHQDGREFYICYPCDDYWYHIGGRKHADGCKCKREILSYCPEVKMELKP